MSLSIKDFVKAHYGQANVIHFQVPLVDFTGSIEAALLIAQIIYWSTRTKDDAGWFYKTYSEWFDELRVTEYQARKAIKAFQEKGWIEVKKQKHNGSPTMFYRLNEDEFSESFSKFLSMETEKSMFGNPKISVSKPKNSRNETQKEKDPGNPKISVSKPKNSRNLYKEADPTSISYSDLSLSLLHSGTGGERESLTLHEDPEPPQTEPDYALKPIAPITVQSKTDDRPAPAAPVENELPPWRLSWAPQDYDPDFCQDVLRRMRKQWPERTLGDAIAKISNAEAQGKTKQLAADYEAFRFPPAPPPNQPACVPTTPPTFQSNPPDPLEQHLGQLGWSKIRAIQHMIEHHQWPDILTQTGTLRGGTVFNWQAINSRAEQLRSAIAALAQAQPTDQSDLIAEYEYTLLRAGKSKREAIAHMVEIGLWDKSCAPETLTDKEIEQVIDALRSTTPKAIAQLAESMTP